MKQVLAVLGDAIAALARGAPPPPPAVIAPLAVWVGAAGEPQLALFKEPTVGALPKPPSQAQKQAEAQSVLRVFAYWVEALGHDRARLTPERMRVIKARLRDGYEEQRLLRAIAGVSTSPWHRGEDPKSNGQRYDDLTLILRDGSHLERFEGMAPDLTVVPTTSESRNDDELMMELRAKLRDASDRKDRAAYDEANAAMTELRKRRGR